MSCLIHSRKRKRVEKRVRFDTENIIVIDTYSALDYDRGSLFSLSTQYKLNPNIKPIESIALDTPPSSPPSDISDIASIEKKRPKLTINTNICADPLFLTKLSTNHVRHMVHDDEDSTNDYLIPVTPTSAFPSFLY